MMRTHDGRRGILIAVELDLERQLFQSHEVFPALYLRTILRILCRLLNLKYTSLKHFDARFLFRNFLKTHKNL